MYLHHLWASLDATFVNTVGLGLDVAGVVLIFFFGIPNSYADSFTWGGNPAKKRIHRVLSGIGCALVVLGFGLQIASNYL